MAETPIVLLETTMTQPHEHKEITLKQELEQRLGAQSLLSDPALIECLSHDVYRQSPTRPEIVVQPKSREALIAVVKIGTAKGYSVVVRGGGASYTDGYLTVRSKTVLIDTSLLKAIEIDEVNASVCVEPGVTWAELKSALDKKGWRTLFWGPFSGLAATICGTLSQNALSHGSGAYGISAASVLSMEVMTPGCGLIKTGSDAAGALAISRNFGPDLTGLFTGDCGALGVKVTATLPLIRKPKSFGALSFAFERFADLHDAMRTVSYERLDDENFAVDAALSKGQIARETRSSRRTGIALSVLKEAPSISKGIAQLIKMGLSGTRALSSSSYLAHYIVTGVDTSESKARMKRIRSIMKPWGREVANTVPTVVRSFPFAPLHNVLGPNGERWTPLHGIFGHSQIEAFHAAYEALLKTRQADMERLGIWTGAMFETVGSGAFLYEVALYWPDERTPYHQHVLSDEFLKSLPTYPKNFEAHDYVQQLRQDIVDLYRAHGAVHFQLGKTYPFMARLEESTATLIRALKSCVDPDGLMNPGALGL